MKAYSAQNRKLLASLIVVMVGLSGCGGSSDNVTEEPTDPVISDPVLPVTLPTGIVFMSIPGGTFTMGNNNLKGPQAGMATEHEVTLSNFSLSETEISVAQFTEFLNSAHDAGLIEVIETDRNGQTLVDIYGTENSDYAGKSLYSLSGTRVMKDHDNTDGDDDPFTGVIEPENPLNISMIGYDASKASSPYFVKSPQTDFDWEALCDYHDYTQTPNELDTSYLNNDSSNWHELNELPTIDDVSNYPVGFVRWWGAKAFALFYGVKLPSEAQWEYAAKGGLNFTYAVHDGLDVHDANWNSEGLHPALHHVRDVKLGNANPYGLYNMGGNVWEWIEDNFDSYQAEAVTDPVIIIEGSTTHAWRGGSWNYHQATLETSARYSDEESHGNDHFGFRIAK